MKTARRFLALALVFLMLFGEVGSPIAMAANAGEPDAQIAEVQAPAPEAEGTEENSAASGDVSAQSPAEPGSDEASPTAPAEEAPAAPAEEPPAEPAAAEPAAEEPVEEAPAEEPVEEVPAGEPVEGEPAEADDGIATTALGDGIMPIAEDTVTIYLYIKITGEASDLLSEFGRTHSSVYSDYSGWRGKGTYITVGKIDIPRGTLNHTVPSPGYSTSTDNWGPEVKQYIQDHSEQIQKHPDSVDLWTLPGFDFGSVNWAGGEVTFGLNATGYYGVGGSWHEDVTITLKRNVSITVNYLDADSGLPIKEKHTEEKSINNDYDMTNYVDQEIDGYEHVRTEGAVSGKVSGQDIVINDYYKEKTYTLSYSWTGAPTTVPENMKLAEGAAIPTLPENSSHKYGDHYTVDSAYTSGSTVIFTDRYGNPLETYTFSGWTDPNNGEMPKGNVEVKGSWAVEKADPNSYLHTVTVNYKSDDGDTLQDSYTSGTFTRGQDYDVSEHIPTISGYTKESVQGAPSGKMGDQNIEITVIYTKDTDGNKIPDKYEATVTYKVVNGTWEDGSKTPKTEDVVFGEKDGNGYWTETNEVTLSAPTGMQADTGYKDGTWDSVPGTVTKAGGPWAFTYSFVQDDNQKKTLTYYVQYYKDGAAEGESKSFTEDVWVNSAQTTLTVQDGSVNTRNYFGDDWTFEKVEPSPVPETVQNGTTISVYYAKDEDRNGVPDKYEVSVTFQVQNGDWNEGGSKSVSKPYRIAEQANDGSWTAKADVAVGAPAVGSAPATGYKAGSWDPALPAAVTEEMDGKTYTYSYEKDSFKVTVKYVADDGTKLGKTDYTKSFEFDTPYDVSGEIPDSIEVGGKTYIKDRVTGAVSGTMPAAGVEITVTYSVDEGRDNIADKYQVTIVYRSENAANGTVGESGLAEYSQVVTIEDESGNPTEKGNVTAESTAVPTETAPDKFFFNHWSMAGKGLEGQGAELRYAFEAKGGETYTFTAHFGTGAKLILWNEDSNSEIGREFVDNAVAGQSIVPYISQHQDAPNIVQKYDVLEPIIPRTQTNGTLVLDRWEITYPADGSNKVTRDAKTTITAYYTKDTDGNKIPDKYEEPVIYKVENGSWEEGGKDQKTEVVVFAHQEANGNWVEDSRVELQGVPTGMKPDKGYHGGSWSPEPGAVTKADGPWEFIFSFTEDADITITYTATTGGSVAPESETLAPATGVATGSTATAAAGYHFVNWTNEANVEVSTDAHFTPEKVDGLNVAATYTANFAENENITITYKATTGGSVEPTEETLAPATGVAIGSTATAAAGYVFENWTKGDEVVSTNAKFVPEKDGGLNVAATYTAHFTPDKNGDGTADYKQDVVIEVKGKSDSHVYNGSEQKVEGYEVISVTVDGKPVDGIPDGVSISTEAAIAKGTEPNTYPMGLDSSDFTVEKGSYKSVTLNVTDGSLIITPANAKDAFVVDTPENSMYDGTEHKWAPTVTDKDGNPLTEGVDYTASYDTDDFVSANDKITVTIEGMGNYEGSVERTYKIAKRPIYLFATNANDHFTYNGEEQTMIATLENTVQREEIEQNVQYYELAKGDVLSYVNGEAVRISAKNAVKNSNMQIHGLPTYQGTKLIQITRAGEDVSSNYTGQFRVAIWIDPRPVTLTSQTLTKTYDGTPLDNGDAAVEITGAGFVDGEGVESYSFSGSQLLPGRSKNTFTYTLKEGTTDDPYIGNYKITTVFGDLTVTDRGLDDENPLYEITMQPNGGTFPYDGGPHSVSGFEASTFTFNGVEFTVEGLTAGASATDAGTVNVTVTGTPTVRDPEGNDVTAQFNVHNGSATLTITPAPVTVTAVDSTKVYGAADPAFTATVTGMVNGEDPAALLDYDFDREAGQAVGAYDVTPVGEEEQGNYNVTYVSGELTITPASVTVTAVDSTKVYGAADPDFTATVTGMVNGEDPALLLDYDFDREAGENVGAYDVTPVGEAVQGNYSVTYVDAELTVTPAPVTVTANDATKVAGAADPVFAATVTGMVNGEDPAALLDYDFDRDPGEAAGDYAITPVGAAAQGNYTVTYLPGTLTITPAPAPAAAPGDGGAPAGVVIDDNPVPLAPGPQDLQVNENGGEVTIDQDETPLAAAPTVGECCILHLIIMLCALTVAVYYTHDRKKRQKEEFETRFQMV